MKQGHCGISAVIAKNASDAATFKQYAILREIASLRF
jgi:hypothetical protein